MAAVDAKWQRVTKPRRAAVYRSIGRAARLARENRQTELAADLRMVMDVLRVHAKAPPRPRGRPRRV